MDTHKFLAVGLLTAAAWLGAGQAARADDCHLVKLAAFPNAISRGGTVTIPVAINGTEERFLVDTGGAFSTISQSVVDQLHLNTKEIYGAELYLADGTMLKYYANVDHLRIGGAQGNHVRLVVQPARTKVGIEDFQGTLAPDFLPNFDLDFDFGHATST